MAPPPVRTNLSYKICERSYVVWNRKKPPEKFGPTVEELEEPLDRLRENANDALLRSVVELEARIP
jgi:hypothetical protein